MAIRYCCHQRRIFRALQRLPRRYYTAEAIRFGTYCPDNLETLSTTTKNSGTLSVVHAIPVRDGDALPCLEGSNQTA